MANRKPGRPKGSPKTGGRQRGTPNAVTRDVRAAAAEIVDDPVYRRRLLDRARLGEWAPGTEAMFWHYAKGRPLDDAFPVEQVVSALRSIGRLFFSLVEDQDKRRRFTLGMKRLGLPAGVELEAAKPSPVRAEEESEWLEL